MTESSQATQKGSDHVWSAVQKMFVAGAAGGFFTALVRGLTQTIQAHVHSGRYGHFSNIGVIRYGFLIVLASYFALSQLRKDKLAQAVAWKDLAFDVLQASVAFIAVYWMGFGTAPRKATIFEAVVAGSVAIFMISFSSFLFFSVIATRFRILTDVLTKTRLIALFPAGLGLVALSFDKYQSWHWPTIIGVVVLLFALVALAHFGWTGAHAIDQKAAAEKIRAAKPSETDTQRAEDENGRKEAELARDEAEKQRMAAELDRDTAEKGRASAEAARSTRHPAQQA